MGTEQYSKAIRETAENLRIIDDAMFRLVAERKEVCQEILRTLLDRPQLKVVSVTPQCVITSLHREIILDVLCILENGTYMNIEMPVMTISRGIGFMHHQLRQHIRQREPIFRISRR